MNKTAGRKAKADKAVSLEELIPVYWETKTQADAYDKQAKEQNKQIKQYMAKMLKGDVNSVDKEAGGWVATYQIRISESFNQDALLEYAKTHKVLKDCVKTVEVIDEKKLEDMLYNGLVPKKIVLELDKFRSKKTTEYLYINKKKEG